MQKNGLLAPHFDGFRRCFYNSFTTALGNIAKGIPTYMNEIGLLYTHCDGFRRCIYNLFATAILTNKKCSFRCKIRFFIVT